jgi:hypothetical protein
MGKSLKDVAMAVLMNENANQATLKPGAAGQEPTKSLGGGAAEVAHSPVKMSALLLLHLSSRTHPRPHRPDMIQVRRLPRSHLQRA